MQLTSLTLKTLDIPFKVVFRHAAASRDKTESAWVIASTQTTTGYGESCPRVYVTGEDMVSVRHFFDQYHDQWLNDIHQLDDLEQWVSTYDDMIDQHPAAWCAIELALLDLLAKENDCTVEHLLGLNNLDGVFQYSAVLGDNEIASYTKQVQQYAGLGFNDFKIKISNDSEMNKEKLAIVKGAIPNARIRLDANNLWQDASQAISYLKPLSDLFFAIEEPVAPRDWKGLSEIVENLGCKIILDESFTRKEDFTVLGDHPENWIINLRVSKLGGLLRSLEYAREAKEKNIACIVGAQVGETSLLTRAGLTVAQACGDNLVAQEGAYGLHLLESDITDEPLMFGKQGKLNVGSYKSLLKPGFGISVTMR